MMRRTLLVLLVLLGVTAPAAAQRPLVGTTLTLTDTSVDSLHVGCAVGSSTCTGGIKAGPIAATTFTGTAISGTTGTFSSTLGVTGTSTLGVVNASGTLTLSGTAPEVSLTNGTSNWITWSANGVSAPTFTTRSAGTKLVLFPNLDGSHADFGFGIESGALWYSVPDTTGSHKVYGGTTLWSTLNSTGLTLVNGLSWGGALSSTGVITPPALSAGNNNNYAPTGFATAYRIRLTSGAASVLTGIAGGTDGREIILCTTNTTTISLSNEDGNSTAANRIVVTAASGIIGCARLLYDGGLSRWIVFGDLK